MRQLHDSKHNHAKGLSQEAKLYFAQKRLYNYFLDVTQAPIKTHIPPGNYLGHPVKFNKDQADGRFFVEDEHFDVLTHHMRFNAEGVDELMPNDTIKFTVVREPIALFESLYNYYRLNRSFEYGESLKMLLDSFNLEVLRQIDPPIDRAFDRIGINQVGEIVFILTTHIVKRN